jgi:hypothetical protein
MEVKHFQAWAVIFKDGEPMRLTPFSRTFRFPKKRSNKTMSRLLRVALSKAGHIEQPYSIDEILDKIELNEYSAELMLQHLLLYISKRENHAHS